MGTTKKGILVLDPRTKILLLLGINIYVFTNSYVGSLVVMRRLQNSIEKHDYIYCLACNQVFPSAILP